MSNTESDSFIEEVSEAVRRDRLFRLMRRWGWIPLLIVLLIVGGTVYREWTQSQDQAAAQARGSAIMAALEEEDPAARLAALETVSAEPGRSAVVVRMMVAAQALEAEDHATAIAALEAVEADAEADPVYRQMATLKRVVLTAGETDPDARIAALTPLTTPGAPFRVLAEEQIALAEVEKGNIDDAIARLRTLLEDTEASGALRQRANELIVALGGTVEAA